MTQPSALNGPVVVLVSYYFPPSPAVGAIRPFRFYKFLRRAGYHCHVVTATAGAAERNPDVVEVPDRAESWRNGDKSGVWSVEIEIDKLLRRFILPGELGMTWAATASASCRRILDRHPGRPSAVLTSFPPLGVHLAGMFFRRRNSAPWIADFRDPMGIVPEESRLDARHKSSLRAIEKRVFKHADAVVSNTDATAAQWRTTYPWAQDKLSVVYNGYDPEEDIRPAPLADGSEHVLLHAGSLYGGRNPNVLLETVRRLRRRACPETAPLKVRLIGPSGWAADTDAALVEEGMREGWLEMPGTVSPQAAQQATASAGRLLLLQPQSAHQIPAKLFQYICIGRPILCVVPRESAIESVLAPAGVPFVCLYPDEVAEEMERKLTGYLRLPVEPVAANLWFREKFDASRQAAEIGRLIDRLIAR